MDNAFSETWHNWVNEHHPLTGLVQDLLDPHGYTRIPSLLAATNVAKQTLIARREFRESLYGPEYIKNEGNVYRLLWLCPYCRQSNCDDALLCYQLVKAATPKVTAAKYKKG